jgi:stromal membrane-associated protein
MRPHTSANTTAPIPRVASQPLSTPQQPQAPPEPKGATLGGVWADLVSLQSSSSSSSFPLQYQAPPQQPSFVGGMAAFQAGTGVEANAYQQQHMASNPFPQQFVSSPSITPTSYAGSQQPYFPSQPHVQPNFSATIQMQSPFFQPRPQPGQLQIHLPGDQHSFPSPGAFASAHAGQGQFFPSSPAMPYPSHSPQVPLSMMSSTPQLQMSMQQPAQFISHSPHPVMTGTPLPMTPQPQMQMHHGPFMAGTPQTGQFSGFQGQGQFTPGGFTGHQWGA